MERMIPNNDTKLSIYGNEDSTSLERNHDTTNNNCTRETTTHDDAYAHSYDTQLSTHDPR